MHCHLHNKLVHPERHQQSKCNLMCSLLLSNALGESGNEHVAHVQQFYLAQKMQGLNQISQT